jgi:hypothetical protein
MTRTGPVSQTELGTAAVSAVLSAVFVWHSTPLDGVQGVTDAAIAAAVTLGSVIAGFLVLGHWNFSWHSRE